MTTRGSDSYGDLAEAAWRWVLDQVRWADGPWIPTSVTEAEVGEPSWDRDGMHSGVGGLAYVLAEVRLERRWTAEEERLAAGIAERVRGAIATSTDCSFFDGQASLVGVLLALDESGAEAAVARLSALAAPDGWPQTTVGPPKYLPDARIQDVTLGTAGVMLAALWARRHGVSGSDELAERAAEVLLAEAEQAPAGLNWRMVPLRFRPDGSQGHMPNFSHGLAGVAASLAVAGVELDRHDLVSAARAGAEHLVTLGDTTGGGFAVPVTVPERPQDRDPVTYGWCHGPTGTSLLFAALERAGVDSVAGDAPRDWHQRCLHAVRTSGVPARLHPGFWDNEGQCCGTAGVGEVFLDAWQRYGHDGHLAFALRLADAVVDRAVVDGPHACWRFLEHRATEPVLPPGVGWMQGAAGIAAFLFRVSRVKRDGTSAGVVPRMDTWWALPG